MLVLTRKHGQRVRLTFPSGEVGWVSVENGRHRTIRVCFDVPRDVVIEREELIDVKENASCDPHPTP